MRFLVLVVFLSLPAAGCKRVPKKPAPPQEPPTHIQMSSQYQPGVPLGELLAEMNLGATAARYRGGLPEDRKSAVYFFEEGDLHVDAVKKTGKWVLSSVPFFEPKPEPAVVRVKKWDAGA